MRRRGGLAAGLSLVLLVGVGCSDTDVSTEGASTSDAASATNDTTVRTTVDEDGFRAELQGVIVEGAPGVADPGVDVTIGLVDVESPDPDAELLAVVDVVIGDHLQPREPVTLTFDLDQQPGESVEYVALRSDSGQHNYVTVEHEVVDGAAVISTEHLSAFSLVQFDPRKWLGELSRQIELGLGLQYPKPACADEDFGHSPQLGDVYFTAEGPGLGTVYLCADRAADDELSMEFFSNGPVAWEITADPAPPSTMPIVQLRLGDLMATAGYRLANDYPDNRVLLTPGAQVALGSRDDELPVSYSGKVDPFWGGVALGVEAALGVASIGQAGKWQKLRDAADVQDAVSCMSGIVSAGARAELGPTISTATTCVQRLMSQLVGSSDALLLLRLGIVSRLLLIAPQGAIAALVASNNNSFSVDLVSIRTLNDEGYLVPEYCDQPERRVSVGETESGGKYTWLSDPLDWAAPGTQVLSMTCSAGGVTWPGVLAIYNGSGERVGTFFLGDLEPEAYRGGFDLNESIIDGDVITVPYRFQPSGWIPYYDGTLELTWDPTSGRPSISGGTATATRVDAPAGGRGLAVDGEEAPEAAESWLISKLGVPDDVVELTDCLQAGIAGRRLSWGGLDITILTDPVPEEIWMYGFAYPVGGVSGWQYDMQRDDGPSPRHRFSAENVRLPADVDTLREHFRSGWDYADTTTTDDGRTLFQAFSGDVTGIVYALDASGTATSAQAGLRCDE